MKVLITGGAGYIGSVLVKELLNWRKYAGPNLSEWWEVISKLTVVDNLIRKQNTMGQFVMDPRFEFVKWDVSDYDLIKTYYDEADVILPLAGVVGAPRCHMLAQQAWNLNSVVPVGMVQWLKFSGHEAKVIYPCTNSGYGSRPDGRFITEEDELKPVSVYGKSKVSAEEQILHYGGISLRLATVMGWSPCMRLDLLVNDFVWRAVKDRTIVLFEKNMKRNYIHIEDVAKAFILAINNYDKMKGQAFNVGLSTANLSKLELAEKIAEQIECHIVEAEFARDPDRRDYLVSNEKIEAMGFKPKWSVENTITQLIKFYKTITLDSANIFYENWG